MLDSELPERTRNLIDCSIWVDRLIFGLYHLSRAAPLHHRRSRPEGVRSLVARENARNTAAAARRMRLMPAMSPPIAETGENRDRYEAILDAAEDLFAMTGFSGTGMRAIAEKADVGQSLLHYYFGTKEQLFDAMFARRSADWNKQRLDRLETLLAEGKPKLEEILGILLRPVVELGRDRSRGSEHFARLILATTLGHEERERTLIKKYYDSFARRFIAALHDCLPGISHRDAVWGYLFTVRIGMTMIVPNDRAYALSDGLCDDSNVEDVLARVVEFTAAGLRKFSSTKDDRKKRPGQRPKKGRA
jgi:AcrR family transcriptional regulator